MSRATTLSVCLALGVLTPGSALAWNHFGQVWTPDRFPFEYTVSDYNETSIPTGYTVEAVQDAYAAWGTVECADLPVEFTGTSPQNIGASNDGVNRHTFDDPADWMAPGVLGRTSLLPPAGFGTPVFVRYGRNYYKLQDTDIVYNNDVDWATDDQIDAQNCNGETSLRSVATHEIGHSFGLAHSCEQTDVCTNPDYLDATMYWAVGPCDYHQRDLGTDDIESINALYGPYVTFACSHELQPGASDTIAVGNVPFTLRCAVTSNPSTLTGATWYFGDGGTETTIDAAHTYEEAGNYSVRVCFDGHNDVCGDYQYCARREGYVRACDVPKVDFTAEHVDGRTWRFLNETDLSVYGCIFDVQWDIFSGNDLIDSISAWEPEYTFEENGDYRVVLNVGGPAGEAAAEASFTVTNSRGSGYGACDTGGPGGGALLALLALIGLRRRR